MQTCTYNVGQKRIEVIRGRLHAVELVYDALVRPINRSSTASGSGSAAGRFEITPADRGRSAAEGFGTLPGSAYFGFPEISGRRTILVDNNGYSRLWDAHQPMSKIIAECTANSLNLASREGMNSVLFQVLGARYSSLSLEEKINIMGKEFVQHLRGETSIERIGWLLETQKQYSTALAVFDRLLPR